MIKLKTGRNPLTVVTIIVISRRVATDTNNKYLDSSSSRDINNNLATKIISLSSINNSRDTPSSNSNLITVIIIVIIINTVTITIIEITTAVRDSIICNR